MEASGAEELEAGSPRRAEPASRLTMEAKSGEGSPRRAEPASPRRHSPWGFAKALGVRDHEARFVPYDPWLEAPPWELAGLAALSALAYGAACLTPLAHGGLLAPRAGPGWAIFCVWLVASATGRALAWLGLPPLAGQLLGGALARNSRAFRGAALTHAYKATIRAAGLGTIMTRSGLELDVGAIRRAGRVAARLTVLPGVSEALAVALFARWVFELPFVLALALGFILAAVSPAVVPVCVKINQCVGDGDDAAALVPSSGEEPASPRHRAGVASMAWRSTRRFSTSRIILISTQVVVGLFDLHSRGYGVAKGIPSIVVAAASMDDVVAMLGFSVCIGLAGGAGNLYQKALAGPAAVVAGALYGCAAGALLGATKLWDADWKLTAATLVLGLLPMFVAERLHAHGGGAIGALLVGVVGSWAWRRRQPAWLAAGAEREALLDEEEDLGAALGTPDGDARAAADRLREVGKKLNAIGRSDADDARKSHLVEANIGLLWTWLAQPLLFGAIGTELNFHRMAPAVAGRALLVVGVGLLVRIPAAYVAVHFDDRLKFREKAFVALAWLPKATVQAALASVPAEVVDDRRRGEAILTTAVLAILATAPLGSLFIQRFGPRWLEREDDAADDAETSPIWSRRRLAHLVGEARAEIERLGGDTTRLAKIVDVIDEWSNPLIPKRPDTSGNALKLMNSAKVKKRDLAAERRRKRWDESAKYCA